ncbi:TetR/AcrR family transcriptional regulator [Gordonia sp. HY002]|uniref:TetR/AcrR family transcriptional regulator n=1 Tax=Gordonia zhenghanii TaxID=2911516 RepID=UPI001EF00B4A|nr:TetR/AcrR family transcriptional regulator [Gordonia zhenghanii]MCF8572243.1 TetR/AcrR family transcriptional regulator [Gordonia zhenghanii]MCF8605079.1 TetR/AcrR family transcriptional regulator [Gordonia zhenghanii]
MPRLTRAERQALTRSELVESAKRRFLSTGFAGTSVDDIAEDAGYSKGAVYSNFQDKRNLCRAVLDAIHHEKLGEIAAIATSGIVLENRIEMLTQWVEDTAGDVKWTMLELEFVVLSRSDPELAAMIVNLRDDAQEMVTAVLQSFLSGLGISDVGEAELPVPLDSVANFLLSTGIGLGIQRAVDPSVSAGPATDALRAAFAILASLAPSIEAMAEE